MLTLRSILALVAGVAARGEDTMTGKPDLSVLPDWMKDMPRKLQSAECPEGIECKELTTPDGLIFNCHVAGEGGKAGDVMLLHGFPERMSMYDELMRQLAAKGFRSVACDQRGYSPGASPPNVENYAYHILRDDVWHMADAAGFGKFHLIGHDHGSVLGWYTAGSEDGRDRLLSYAGLSVPHNDAFAAGLYGPEADEQQQVASQYFSIFTMNNSASLDFGLLYHAMGSSDGFNSEADFQKALWWYNGAYDEGVMAGPPQWSSGELLLKGEPAIAAFRAAFGKNPAISEAGTPQRTQTGKITMPALFVCGNQDSYLKCARPFAKKTQDYCVGGYTYLEAVCGHSVLDCSDKAETQKIIDGIVSHVAAAASASAFYA